VQDEEADHQTEITKSLKSLQGSQNTENAILLQCLHNRSHKTEIQFLEGSLQE
jgi:hypothetical protein